MFFPGDLVICFLAKSLTNLRNRGVGVAPCHLIYSTRALSMSAATSRGPGGGDDTEEKSPPIFVTKDLTSDLNLSVYDWKSGDMLDTGASGLGIPFGFLFLLFTPSFTCFTLELCSSKALLMAFEPDDREPAKPPFVSSSDMLSTGFGFCLAEVGLHEGVSVWYWLILSFIDV